MGQLASGDRVADRDLAGLRRIAVALALTLLTLNVLDIAVTNILVEGFGAVEINPLMAPVIGTPWAVALKVGVPMVAVALATRVVSRRSVTLLSIVVAIYVLVAALGLGQIAYVYA